ncbi:hypothetical protein D3C71_1534810 [compost metagenome]
MAQVDGGQVETEHLNGLLQARQPQLGQRGAMMRRQRRGDDGQVGRQFLRRLVGGRRHGAAARQVLPGQRLGGGGQAGVHTDQRAAVGLVAAVRGIVAAVVGQRQQFRVGRNQHGGDRQFRAQRVHLLQIVFEQHGGLAQQRALQRAGVHIGIAVAVAADPATHAQERFQRRGRGGKRLGGLAVQELGQIRVQARDDLQKGAAVVRKRVFDLVGHRQARVAQHAGLP